MNTTTTIFSIRKVIILLAFFCASIQPLVHAGEIEQTCDASITTYSCPLCGGMTVTDCLDCDGFTNTDTKHKACFKRKLFAGGNNGIHKHNHYRWNDIMGVIVWFVAAGMATACGVGGGGIYVPLGILLLKFAPKSASGLSQCSIFGASLGGLILNAIATHPKSNIRDTVSSLTDAEYLASGGKFYTRPRIDYDMALFLSPMQMAGAVVGVMIQKVMPNWLYLLSACCILGITGHKTFNKYLSAARKERENKVGAAAKAGKSIKSPELEYRTSEESDSDDASNDDVQAVLIPFSVNKGNHIDYDSVEKVDSIEQRRELLDDDMRQYPMEKIFGLVLLWMGLIAITFLKGGKGVPSLIGVTCQSPWYYVLIASQFLWTFSFSSYFGRQLMMKQESCNKANYPFLADDVTWDFDNLMFYGTFTFIAGIVAGLIGIGGGMVLGPLMLIMGIHPVVSSATNATMIVLTSSGVAILFITSGLVDWDYAAFFFSTCFSGALVGKKYIDDYVKRSGRASLLIFILATILILSTLGCFYIAISGLAENNWCFDGMKAFCDKAMGGEGACPLSNPARALEELFTQ